MSNSTFFFYCPSTSVLSSQGVADAFVIVVDMYTCVPEKHRKLTADSKCEIYWRLQFFFDHWYTFAWVCAWWLQFVSGVLSKSVNYQWAVCVFYGIAFSKIEWWTTCMKNEDHRFNKYYLQTCILFHCAFKATYLFMSLWLCDESVVQIPKKAFHCIHASVWVLWAQDLYICFVHNDAKIISKELETKTFYLFILFYLFIFFFLVNTCATQVANCILSFPWLRTKV